MSFRGNFVCIYMLVLLFVVIFCLCFCSPVSYKEDKTTPKVYNDRFKLKKEYQTIPDNESSEHHQSNVFSGFRQKENTELAKVNYKPKSVSPGEKTMKQSDDDDDDDDDGGEYEGLDSDDLAKKKQPTKIKQDQMPMMIIREVDMVAMQIPMQQGQAQAQSQVKECQKPEGRNPAKEWSEWSACSRPCGDGLQSRWRLKPGVQEREQQVRLCHEADCVPEYSPFRPHFL